MKPQTPRSREVSWERREDGEFRYLATVDGAAWALRVNDFPADYGYTLFIGGVEAEHMDEWPTGWLKKRDVEAEQAAVRRLDGFMVESQAEVVRLFNLHRLRV